MSQHRFFVSILPSLLVLLAACGTNAPTTTPGDASILADARPRDPSVTAADATAEPTPPDAAAPDATIDPVDAGRDAARADAGDAANPCEAANGICLGSVQACTTGGGTIASGGAPGCVFSDGPGVCCVPPAPQPEGDGCAARGGVCAPIAGCNFVHGAFAPAQCQGVGVVCCLPSALCGAETQVCCAPGGSATFRPACDRGAWVCTIPGTTLQPPSACP